MSEYTVIRKVEKSWYYETMDLKDITDNETFGLM